MDVPASAASLLMHLCDGFSKPRLPSWCYLEIKFVNTFNLELYWSPSTVQIVIYSKIDQIKSVGCSGYKIFTLTFSYAAH